MSKFDEWVPIYVTRKTADGRTTSINTRQSTLTVVRCLVTANIVGWSVFGLAELGERAVNLLG